MIDTSNVWMPSDFIGNETAYPKLTYIYALHVDGIPFYVGSTTNPASRYLTHLAKACRDTREKVAQLQSSGTNPDMRVIDITDRQHRLNLEAHYISLLERKGYRLTNTSRYPVRLREYQDCPTCYRSLKANTLQASEICRVGE